MEEKESLRSNAMREISSVTNSNDVPDYDDKFSSPTEHLDTKVSDTDSTPPPSSNDSCEDLEQEDEMSKCLQNETSDKQVNGEESVVQKKDCLLKDNQSSIVPPLENKWSSEKEKNLYKQIHSINLNKLQMPPENPPTKSRPVSLCSSLSYEKSTLSTLADFCRICHCETDPELGQLITPCYCNGSLRHVHQSCLQQWIKSSDSKHCELCGYQFVMDSKLKPFRKWEKLSMTKSERRKIICSVMFHIIAITCVVWSLYVLIGRTADEIKNGKLYWPFWTKLVVVAIGITGGLVFMYVQCKVYVLLWRRLKAFNRTIYIQNHMKENAKQIECIAQRTNTLDRRSEQCTSHSIQPMHSIVSVDVCHQNNRN